jgi:hypothetical protein
MRRITTYVVLFLLATSSQVVAQSAPDTVAAILRLSRVVDERGAEFGSRIWPGFRPDTIPVLWVIPNTAKLLTHWRYPLPGGFTPFPGVSETAWTDTQTVSLPSGRFIAFMGIDSADDAALLVGTAIHEAFHSLEKRESRESRRFGRGENSMLIADYPVFDVTNEAAFALEGHLLRAAYLAKDLATTRARVAEFLAVRERRHRVLDSAFAEFETMAELHEGLAQYTLLRGLAELGAAVGEPWQSGARGLVNEETALLDSLLVLSRRSVRRRFYATGSTMALLLDRLTGDRWKQRVLHEDLDLEELLRESLGTPTGDGSRRDEWYQREVAGYRAAAEASVAALRAARREQADRILAHPGLRVTIASDSGRLQWCGFDPQNTLPVGDGRMLHMRFLNLCGPHGAAVSFEVPVIENRETGEFEAVIDAPGLRLSGPGMDVKTPKARVTTGASGARIVLE